MNPPGEEVEPMFEVDSSAAKAEDPLVAGEAFGRVQEDFGKFLD